MLFLFLDARFEIHNLFFSLFLQKLSLKIYSYSFLRKEKKYLLNSNIFKAKPIKKDIFCISVQVSIFGNAWTFSYYMTLQSVWDNYLYLYLQRPVQSIHIFINISPFCQPEYNWICISLFFFTKYICVHLCTFLSTWIYSYLYLSKNI